MWLTFLFEIKILSAFLISFCTLRDPSIWSALNHTLNSKNHEASHAFFPPSLTDPDTRNMQFCVHHIFTFYRELVQNSLRAVKTSWLRATKRWRRQAIIVSSRLHMTAKWNISW
jgi:hypothetical protein